MIHNATLTRIDTPGPANGAGDSVVATGSAMSCRCLVSNPTQSDLAKDWGKIQTGNQIFRAKVAPLFAAMAAAGLTAPPSLGQYFMVMNDAQILTRWRVVMTTIVPHKQMSMVVAELQED